MVRKLYPGGKAKAFNFSYDDGVMQDVRFVRLLNKYGLKGTFNLNSGLLKQEFTWTHACGLPVKRLSEDAVKDLYDGHEVACHTYSHPYMDQYSETDVLREIGADRFFLERLFGREVAGYATPFYYFSDLIASCVWQCGLEYARISETDLSFAPRKDYYHWKGGLFHEDPGMEDYVEHFLTTEEELAICQIVGHTYDLDVYDMWDQIETICRKISACDDIWPATHLELVRYLRNMEMAQILPEKVVNTSEAELWFEIDGVPVMIPPGKSIHLCMM